MQTTTLVAVDSLGLDEVVSGGVNFASGGGQVATLRGGGHVVVFNASGPYNPDPYSSGVYLQVYDAAGGAVGGPIVATQTVLASQSSPAVIALDDGGFVVTWTSGRADKPTSFDVYQRRFDADATPLGDEQRVHGPLADQQWNSGLTALDGGGYIAYWQSANWPKPARLEAQIFDGAGQPVGTTLELDLGAQGTPDSTGSWRFDIVKGPSGGFLVLHVVNFDQTDVDAGLYLRRHAADGTPVQDAVRLDEGPVQGLGGGSIRAVGDGYVVAYSVRVVDEDGRVTFEPHTRWLDAEGQPTAHPLDDRTQGTSAIVTLPDGRLAVFWSEQTVSGTYDVLGQRFEADGTALGEVFVVNDARTRAQAAQHEFISDVGVRADGAVIVTWYSFSLIEQAVIADFSTDTTPLSALRAPVPRPEVATAGPSMAATPDGGHLLAWSDAGDGGAHVVRLQRHDADGEVVGDGLQVDAPRAAGIAQRHADVAVLHDGRAVVTWTAERAGGGRDVLQQVSGVDGAWVAPAQRVGFRLDGAQHESSVAALEDGGWILSWTERFGHRLGADIVAQRYDADGDAVGAAFVVNDRRVGSQQTRADTGDHLAALADGGWVVVWTDASGSNDLDRMDIRARVYGPGGKAEGPSFTVNTSVKGNQDDASVAAVGDGFVVAWVSPRQDENWLSIVAQRYDGDGARVGAEFVVDTWGAGVQNHLTVVGHDDGRFAVLWESSVIDGSVQVHGQAYAADGRAVGGEFVLPVPDEAPARTDHTRPAAVWRDDGALVVGWGTNTADQIVDQVVVTAGLDGGWFGG